MSLKLLDILKESMADGKAFKAFEDYAIAKSGSQTTNEENMTGEDVMDIPDNELMDIINEILEDDMNDDNKE